MGGDQDATRRDARCPSPTCRPVAQRPRQRPAALHGGRRQGRHAVPRAASSRSRAPNQLLVVAAPLKDADDTLHQLLIVELAVAASVLAAVLLLGLWLVRVGLRPLGRIEQTAAAIAGGDLSQRVENDDPRTEVGRLGGALNTMLGQIEEAFDERTASENRLRRFIADASHELRTPLAAVRAYAELFDRGARERPDDLERSMNGIQRESRRMGLLVDDLLLLARLDQGRPLERKPVELEDVARDAVEAARTLDPGREIELDAPVPVEVQGDRERLRQILDNLLANVRAHTPAGSAATVRVLNGGDAAVIEVADAGPGLSDEQLSHAFERFYRGDSLPVARRRRRRARPGDHLGDRRIARRLGDGRQRGPRRRAGPDGSGRDPPDGTAACVGSGRRAGRRAPLARAALARPCGAGTFGRRVCTPERPGETTLVGHARCSAAAFQQARPREARVMLEPNISPSSAAS